MVIKKNLLVAQSGGPTTAINASLAGVIQGAMNCKEIQWIYGGLNGLAGILEDQIVDLTAQLRTGEDLYRLSRTPAAALGSCRMKMKDPALTPDVYAKLLEVFERLNIGYFLYIGGNDSMDTVDKISRYCMEHDYPIQVVGVPKTIDNDLMMTDHTPGFGSAARYVVSAITEIACDTAVYNQPSVAIVEIMGRDAGWLTASSALARIHGGTAPHIVLLPEIPFHRARFMQEVKEALYQHTGVVIAVSEGIRNEDGSYAQQSVGEGMKDAFGHVTLGGAGEYIKSLIQQEIGCKVRAIELSTLQRAAAHCASKTDLDEAIRVGEQAVMMAVSGQTAVMAAIHRISDNPYQTEIRSVPVGEAANGVRSFPKEWINGDYSLTSEGIEYFLPLIQGDPDLPRKNGIQEIFVINRSKKVHFPGVIA